MLVWKSPLVVPGWRPQNFQDLLYCSNRMTVNNEQCFNCDTVHEFIYSFNSLRSGSLASAYHTDLCLSFTLQYLHQGAGLPSRNTAEIWQNWARWNNRLSWYLADACVKWRTIFPIPLQSQRVEKPDSKTSEVLLYSLDQWFSILGPQMFLEYNPSKP